jgi:MFS family permease
LYTIIILTNSVYSLASLFLPSVFKEKAVPGVWVGLVFSMYSIAVVLVSPIVGILVTRMGFANLLALGLVIMGTSIIPVGFLPDIEDDNASIALGIFLRALQGTASALINATCFSLAANKYAHQVTFMVGLLEATSGIGLVIGLVGGSIVYEVMGYKSVFILFGTLLPIMALVTRVLFFRIARQERLDVETSRIAEPLLVVEHTDENYSTI